MTDSNLEKALKKSNLVSTIMSVVVAIFTTMSIGFGFYYHTKSTLEAHDRDIQQMRQDIEETKLKVTDIEIFRGVSNAEIKNLEEKVDKIDEKLDKILLKMQ